MALLILSTYFFFLGQDVCMLKSERILFVYNIFGYNLLTFKKCYLKFIHWNIFTDYLAGEQVAKQPLQQIDSEESKFSIVLKANFIDISTTTSN